MIKSPFTRIRISAFLACFMLVAAAPLYAAESSDAACLEGCEQVLPLCRKICHDTQARANDQYGDDPHKPVYLCLENCEEDFAICKASCGSQP